MTRELRAVNKAKRAAAAAILATAFLHAQVAAAAQGVRLNVAYTAPVHSIGPTQPGGNGQHYKCLSGLIPGFTVGVNGSTTMKAALDAYEALPQMAGSYIEAVGVGLPNSMGTPSLGYFASDARFYVFATPIIPHGDSSASLTKLLQGGYDSLILATFNALKAAGLDGARVSCRVGWEFNSGAADGPGSGFEWSTAHTDPQTGQANGIHQYHLAAAHFETIARSTGWSGFIEWNGGNGDTSALPIATAMPTHGNPSNTLWGWDIYAVGGGGDGKNNPTGMWSHQSTIYDNYVTYCVANGYLMGHGEYAQGHIPSSPYVLNDNNQWYPLFYAKLKANAATIAYAMHYQQNQNYGPNGQVLTESYQIAFSVDSSGLPNGTASSTVTTGPYAYGASALYQSGSANTTATIGTLRNSSDAGTTWVVTTDPNKVLARDSWFAYFGGTGGLGSVGLQVTPAAPPPATQLPPPRAHTTRVLSVVYG